MGGVSFTPKWWPLTQRTARERERERKKKKTERGVENGYSFAFASGHRPHWVVCIFRVGNEHGMRIDANPQERKLLELVESRSGFMFACILLPDEV